MPSAATLADWETRFTDYLRENWATGDGAHDLHHLLRVWKTCRRLNASEEIPADELILCAAAFFHDFVSLPKNHPDRSTSSLVSADRTATLLQEHFPDFPADRIGGVHHAIHAHSFSAAVPVRTPEAAILQDADRMEALGAIGLARMFYTAGKMNALLFDPLDPLAERRAADDTRFSLDHVSMKLLKLPGMMNTASGKAMAEAEAEFIRAFREKLLDEIG